METTRIDRRLVCRTCGATSAETRLYICPFCHQRVCLDHAYRMGGKLFCCRGCAEEFYYSEEHWEDD